MKLDVSRGYLFRGERQPNADPLRAGSATGSLGGSISEPRRQFECDIQFTAAAESPENAANRSAATVEVDPDFVGECFALNLDVFP